MTTGAVAVATAAVDCGTNSTRLLIVDAQGRHVVEELRTTRLGQDLDRTGTLRLDAIERTVTALQGFRVLMDEHRVERVRAIATSAARDAGNHEQFFSSAAEALGVEVELVSGEEEGRLAYAGATADLDRPPYLVLDIGGGSTELVLGDDTGVIGARSIDVGCVRLTERYFRSDPPSPEDLADAFATVGDLLGDVGAELPISTLRPMLVGVAGTITTIAALGLGLDSYDRHRVHGSVLQRDRVEESFRSFSRQPSSGFQVEPLLPSGRADVLVGGLVVLLGVLRHFDFDACRVSHHDLLDGLAKSIQ